MARASEHETDGKRTDGPHGILQRHERMAARVTEMRMNMAALHRSPGREQLLPAGRVRRSSRRFSRELRFSLDDEGCLMHVDGAWQSRRSAGSPRSSTAGTGRSSCIRAIAPRVRDPRPRRGRRGLRSASSTCGSPSRGRPPPACWTFVAGSGTDSILGLGHERTDPPARPRRDAAAASCSAATRSSPLASSELEDRYTAVEGFAATAAHQLAEPLIVAESSAIMVAEELGATSTRRCAPGSTRSAAAQRAPAS